MEENLDKNAPIAEFEGYVECPVFAGDCSITLDADGLSVTGVFDQLAVMYGEIRSITATDYRLTLDTVGGPLSFSRMGQEQLIQSLDRVCEHKAAAAAAAFMLFPVDVDFPRHHPNSSA